MKKQASPGTGARFFAVFALVPAAFCLMSCSREKPEIKFGTMGIVLYENGGKPAERMSFFILPSDGDGLDDLDELWLYHDWESLSWQMTSDDWIQETIDGQLWIGSRAIAMDNGAPLPRGQYRAVLVDKGGERTERQFTFDAPAGRPFPSFSVAANRYRIVSVYPQQHFVAYDNDGNYLITIRVPADEGEISALGLPGQARSVALWSFDPEHSLSAFSDVVPLND